MTHDTHGGSTVGIGELAARTGLPVKTIRYYSDIGLLPESGRSPGGHRRYATDTPPRLRLIQHLRALGTPIAAIAAVTTGQRPLADLVTHELDTVQAQMHELTWRQGALQALEDCPGAQQPRRLALLAGVGRLDEAHDHLMRYWHWALPTGLPQRLAQAVIEGAVPTPPATPTTPTVLAYAELHALTTAEDRRRQPQSHQVGDVASFYAGILDACTLATEALDSGCPTKHAEALDHFVGTYARIGGHDDGPAFRAHLRTQFRHGTRPDSFPLRYWRHALSAIGGTPPRPARRPSETSHRDMVILASAIDGLAVSASMICC
ncbi:MerR family DNA-binding transcriptional regulator [Streptomyces noursei]|uniref:helix-turn-helix domain-containing protein n=1 Tax=Streptomyces noursei TaxID=1971 RepID=UPI0035E13FFE